MQSLVEGEFETLANSVFKNPQKLNILHLRVFFFSSSPPKMPPWKQESLELDVGQQKAAEEGAA